MSKIQLVAIKAARYAGQSLAAGDVFEATAKDARILKAVGKAKDVPAEQVVQSATAEGAQPELAAKLAAEAPARPGKKGAAQERAYNRCDLVAKSK